MEILGKLGIDFKLLIAQIINFGLLLLLLSKFLYKPIIKRIESDEKELGKAKLMKAETEKEKKKSQKEQTQELAAARKKAKDIVLEAEKIAEKIETRARKETDEEKEKVLKQIRSRLENIENEEGSK